VQRITATLILITICSSGWCAHAAAQSAGATTQGAPRVAAGPDGDDSDDDSDDDERASTDSDDPGGRRPPLAHALHGAAHSGEDDDAIRVGYQVEAAVASNSIWRGLRLWSPALSPTLVSSAALDLENLGNFDLSAEVWASWALHRSFTGGPNGGAWLVPSLTGTAWLSEQLYLEVGYAAYLQPGALLLDYQHDVSTTLTWQYQASSAATLKVSAGQSSDPVRRLGIYVHGDVSAELVHQAWTANASVELGTSHYQGLDALPWGLQALMGTLSLRRTLVQPFYVQLTGTLAYSHQARLWREPASNAALSLAIGAQH
jgi:hypothetical protein